MAAYDDGSAWAAKLQALRNMPYVDYVAHLPSFSAPPVGHFFHLREANFLVIKSQTMDGVTLAVAPARAKCLFALQLPPHSALVLTANAPATLETTVPAISRVLAPIFVCEPP
ncbi:hypothetical protein BWQ96_05750 [Gracilariopsis chorda]|uniref:Uncharacterized protein n=1 Tax=Gracilariopsis chorda TaxID=448386 RepID=A0A2V3IQU7_9FLOR|nr:hypothetical protein BWQ96_05750 [Gracilariopsis chorda]|eukprot:PXF44478.1 hypothetical protein BWQ96_05750 [Gracilariopsis chorda]